MMTRLRCLRLGVGSYKFFFSFFFFNLPSLLLLSFFHNFRRPLIKGGLCLFIWLGSTKKVVF